MDAIKKERKILRTSFTKAVATYEKKAAKPETTQEERIVAFQLIETKMAELDICHAKYNGMLFKSESTEEQIQQEVESDDEYKATFLAVKLSFTQISTPTQLTQTGTNHTSIITTGLAKTRKWPHLELPKFNGNIKDWLPFWSQFKKIHEDKNLTKEDKFQYLLQVTVPDSRAHELVKSYPPTGENYEKVIVSLKSRFGRDDIIVEFYVRELLGLVLQNAVKGSKKLSLSSIYDRVESYVRALETLGVTTDKCAAMLYPLVEFSLPEEILRAWQRSGQRNGTDENGENQDRLSKLLKFLQIEVENEERIDMALTGFGFSTEGEKGKLKPKAKQETTSKDVPSASVLYVARDNNNSKQVKQNCIFCKELHESEHCESARKIEIRST